MIPYLSSVGGYPLNGQNPLKRFWQVPLRGSDDKKHCLKGVKKRNKHFRRFLWGGQEPEVPRFVQSGPSSRGIWENFQVHFVCSRKLVQFWGQTLKKRNVTNCAKEGGVWMDGWMGCWNKKGILELWYWKWFIKICLFVRILRNQSVFLDVLWIFCGVVVSVKYHQFWFTATHFYFYHR